MTQRNRGVPDKDFFHQQTQNLLSHPDIQRLGSQPELTAKSRQAL
jgi:hypothetical protein